MSLESLRAANHFLLRICRRLSDERANGGAGLTAIQWKFFEEYFSQLASGAVQALGPNLRLRDALTHEYARTFALCLSACPEGAVRMTGHLAEARLIADPYSEDDLAARIEGQLAVLRETFCIGIHGWVEYMFGGYVLKPDLDRLLLKLPKLKAEWERGPARALRKDLSEVERLFKFLGRLSQFARELAGDVRDRRQDGDETLAKLKESARVGLDSQIFRHSWKFWHEALQDDQRLKAMQAAPLGARIRPDVVHFTRSLATWARDWAANLDEKYREAEMFQPEYRLFKEVLDRLRRAAEGFPSGAAVQTNLVVGILGHHLLEDLDLHVLELREIARNLDPITVDSEDKEDDEETVAAGSVESAFASLLVRRAQRARSLPKNLRTLSKVLNPEEVVGDRRPDGKSLLRFVEEFCKLKDWLPLSWKKQEDRAVNPRERELLRLILDELDQNHRYHSGFIGEELAKKRPEAVWGRQGLVVRFPVSCIAEVGAQRWSDVKKACLLEGQSPCEPKKGGQVPSSGVGLYLSCLAASMVGWKVSLGRDPDRDAVQEGWFVVRMEPLLPGKTVKGKYLSAVPTEEPVGHLGKIVNVVVIDDKVQVALYAWRELGRVPGFGSAEVQDEEAARLFQSGPLETPDREFAIWWVSAEKGFSPELAGVMDRLPKEDAVHFLVDVRGPVTRDTTDGYNWQNAVKEISERRGGAFPNRIWLVSSYEHGVRIFESGGSHPFEILDKTPETFRTLRKKFYGSTEIGEAEHEKDQGIHILVTGAGFEVKDRPEEQRLGTPRTWRLLEQWIDSSFGEGSSKYMAHDEQGKPIGFPIPRSFKGKEWQALHDAAKASNLDNYWSLLLEAARKEVHTNYSKGLLSDSGEATADVALAKAQREYKLREDFRQEFVRDDWGYLPQAIAAASLPWSVWLSTNYTRFADRAIALVSRLADNHTFRPWRTIEVSEEAERLSRQILHEGDEPSLDSERTLVKLHGDLGHVLTMAIAGEDKTFLSRLPSFAPLYLAAQDSLERRSHSARDITWHIVGHGLKDELLLRVIERVYRSEPWKHRFVVVDPATGGENQLGEHPVHRLLRKLNGDWTRVHAQARCAPAGLYLTRLQKQGLASFESVLLALDRPMGWID